MKPLDLFSGFIDLNFEGCLVQLDGKDLIVDLLDQVHIADYLSLNFLMSL